MSLSIKNRDGIRKVRKGWFYVIDENGTPKYPNDIEEKPNFELGELRNQIVDTLKQMGYTVNFVNPRSANCIIRVYKSEEAYGKEKYRILGAHCYTKDQNGKWKCIDRLGEEYGVDFSKHVIRAWFFQDEYWDVSVDFFDTYVKLVKEN
jgi:hypothetical protein